MKKKHILLPLFASGALILPSWGEPATHLIQAEAQEEAPSSGADLTVVPDFDIDAMAKKLGFAAHAAENTEGYFSLIGGNDMYERLKNTEIGKFLLEAMKENGEDLDEIEGSEEFSMLKAVVGEELFMAFGDSAGIQGAHLNAISKSSNYHQMKMLVKMAAMSVGGDDDGEGMSDVASSWITGIFTDPKAGLGVFEKASMPPITIGFKVSDADQREMISQTISGGIMSMIDMGMPVEPIDEKKGEVQLTGISLKGKTLADLADPDTKEEMKETFGSAAEVERFLEIVAKKNLQVATGVKDDYIFIYLGESLDGLKFADQPANSLLSNAGLDFLKAYTDKDIRMFLFGEEEAMQQVSRASEVFASMARGIQGGLAETDIFGDTRDIQALLEHVASSEEDLFKMIDQSRSGMVGFLEDGFKIETHGGGNLAYLDVEAPHSFSSLGAMDDLLYYSNSRTNPEFTGKLLDMLDSLGQASFLMADRISGTESTDRDLLEFSEGFQMYNQFAAGELKVIWEALSTDWSEGTGNESALVIDTKGTLPKIPEVPKAIIKEGRIPRIAYVAPVTDRSKIANSWTKIEKSIESLLENVAEAGGPEIPMQEIDDNTKEGLTYFSTAIQFSTKDARPVVGLNDERFYLSTSQNLIAEIEAKLAAGAPAEQKGSYARLNFKALQGLGDHWLKVLKENQADIFDNEYKLDDFKENLPMIEKALKAFGELEEMTMHSREEGGESRSSIHFKMK